MAREQHGTTAGLLEAFGMSEQDLAINRQGRLAPGQQSRLRRMAAVNGALTLLLGGGLLWVLLAVAAQPLQWWRWLLVAALELVLVFAASGWIRKLLTAAGTGEVVCHSGPV